MKHYEEELFELARRVVEEAEENAAKNPTSDFIQIVVVEPNRKPYVKEIPNTLEAMQDIVGGWIENVTIGETVKGARVGITLNEEGKLQDLPFNRRIIHFDVLVGTFFITAYNLAGDNVSLSNEECDMYIKRFSTLEVYI
jgi:hypothetical protein